MFAATILGGRLVGKIAQYQVVDNNNKNFCEKI